MPLHIYNTLTRKKELFTPIHEGHVGMYVCGPTVYGLSHLGHAKSYVSFDVVVRYLRHLKYDVLYVQNVTDVGHLTDDADEGEDKIQKQSRKEKIHPMQVAETFTREYFRDMDALNVLRPDISPRATGHITEQIELITRLIEAGVAYEVNGSVYFDVHTFASYGRLSGRSLEEAESGTRVDVKSEKRHPADFALWKKAEVGHIMRWPSPWGEGFPGWHLECSAMSMKYLGESFDIHGGGMDNQFPHHECEIAQSESVTHHQFVRYWMHNNLVTVNGQKMGKSLGNFITLKDAFKKHPPMVVRFFIMQSHYRSTLDFSEAALDASGKGLEKLLGTVSRLKAEIGRNRDGAFVFEGLEDYRRQFFEAMDDDFNAPAAIGVLFDLARAVNDMLAKPEGAAKDSLAAIEAFFRETCEEILGIVPAESAQAGMLPSGAESLEPKLMDVIIAVRKDIRTQKLWALSDKIRDELKAAGVMLEDGKDGTHWKRMLS
ncbi:MAG: cysteine--tRNA ligase [Acidobacteriota bacterium]